MSYFEGIKPNKEDYCTMVLYKENAEIKTIYDEDDKVKAVRRKHLFKCSLCGETMLKRCDNDECKKKKYMCKCMKKTYSNDCKFYRTYSKGGVMKSLYSNNIETSILRGHSKPAYSLEELMDYLLNNKIFNKLYENWVNNNFKKSLRPSIDRIDSNKGYSFDNIQIVTFHQNQLNYKKEIRSGNREIWNQKKTCKIDKDTNEVIECYKSASEAGEINNISYKTILNCCNGYLKTYKGFIWKFKDEIKFEIPKKPFPKLNVDDKVLVRDDIGAEWYKSHFHSFDKDSTINCFVAGRTEWTAGNEYANWRYWKLPEEIKIKGE